MKLLSTLILIIGLNGIAHTQGIKGRIVDTNKEPIAYANIYVPDLKTGTSSNIEGKFDLKLPEGEWEILFQYIGYKTVKAKYTITGTSTQINVTLKPQNVRIKEIKVLASGEDPAYHVMRHAIAMSPYYSNQVAEYNCKLYLKGSGVINKVPRLFKKKLEKQGVKKDKLYIIESVNEIHFELPDKLEQKVIALRTNGDDNNTNPMEMVTTNLYNVSKYGIVSPVNRNAFKTYNFELVGVFEDQGKLINKIKVIPKVKGKGTFAGFINIVDGYWNIHSAELNFKATFMDVDMQQLYALVDSNTWMPTSLNFEIKMQGLGFGMTYNYVASFSEYKISLNDKLDHSFIHKLNLKEEDENQLLESIAHQSNPESTNKPSKNEKKISSLLARENLTNREAYKLERLLDKEINKSLPPPPLEIEERVKSDKSSINNDSAYWSEIRPIPLTQVETIEFNKKDSVVNAHNTPEYKDSIRAARMKFKVQDVILGRRYSYGYDSTLTKSNLQTSGLINTDGLSFNTVDGFKYKLPFSFNITDTLGHFFQANSSVSYGFSRKKLNGQLSLFYRYNGIKRSWLSFDIGHILNDYKSGRKISPQENDLYTLFFEKNIQKFYENRFISANWGTEIANGLRIKTGIQFAKRSPVLNHSNYKFIDVENREYTPNIPPIPNVQAWQLNENKAFITKLELTYTPKQHYRIRNKVKYPAHSDYPTVKLNYKKGIDNFMGSQVNFDLLTFSLKQNVRIGINDVLKYSFRSGKFINNKTLFAQDYKFFSSNNQELTLSNPDEQFYLPAYYELFSKDYFIEGHIKFDLDKFLIKRLPVINGSLIREKFTVNYLTTESISNYMEIAYSLEDIFLMFDVGFIVGFKNFKDSTTGIRLSINLN